jgi:DNA-binding transcriptional MerR regulator
MTSFTIGKVAALTGVKVPTIRFYENIGLMPLPRRTRGGQRRYGAEAVDRLRCIRNARSLGFEMDAIRKLVALSDHPDAPCKAAAQLARDQVAMLDVKLKKLRVMRAELLRMIASCSGPTIADCSILTTLSKSPTRGGDSS